MYPVVLQVVEIRPEILLQGLILLFGLPICLRVVRSAELLFDAKVVAECCPEFRCKLGPAIGDYAQRDPSAS